MQYYITTFKLDNIIHELWKTETEKQKAVCIEELSELIQEICKDLRGKENRIKIIEELADVLIISQALQDIYSISNYELLKAKEFKEHRTIKRLKENSLVK